MHTSLLIGSLLACISCTNIKKEVQAMQNNAPSNDQSPTANSILPEAPALPSDTLTDEQVRGNISKYIKDDIFMELTDKDTRGVTDINEFLKNYDDEYLSRVVSIKFGQGRTSEGGLEHLGVIERVPNLRNLTVSSNLKSVDVGALPRTLTWLDLSINNISVFDAGKIPPFLYHLDLSYNNISVFDTGSLPRRFEDRELLKNPELWEELPLGSLNLSSNPIEGTFEVTINMSNLHSLCLWETKISRIEGLEHIRNMIHLHCFLSPIENTEEFLKLEKIWDLSFSFPKHYSDDDKENLKNKILERHPPIYHYSGIMKGERVLIFSAGE